MLLIATSNSTYNGMNNTNGGTCLTNNMKIIVRVSGLFIYFDD